MKKPIFLKQLKSPKLWKDSISLGLAVFGAFSAIWGVFMPSLNSLLSLGLVEGAMATFSLMVVFYLAAVIFKWVGVRSSVNIKVRGIKVTVRQGNIFEETGGWKVIGVDNTFSTSDDDSVITHTSLHGQLIQRLIRQNEIDSFREIVSKGNKENNQIGSAKTYKDYILLVMTELNQDNEAHTDNQKFESTLRKMWTEICRVYSGKPIYLPLLGDGIIRFDGISEKPTPFALLKCIICTLKTSNVQIKSPVTILIYDRMDEINLYDLKGL